MLELIVKVLMALAVVGFIGYPLLKVREGDEEPEMLSEEAEELYRRKESAYSAIKELEFDYRTGKLSESDFHELDAKYRSEAIEILEAIDLLESGQAVPAPEEKPAAASAEAASSGAAASGTAATASAAKGAGRSRAGRRGRSKVSAEPESLTALVCGECGRENPAGSKFCASCGQALVAAKPGGGNGKGPRVAEDECADCGAAVDSDHKFCASCGAEVRA